MHPLPVVTALRQGIRWLKVAPMALMAATIGAATVLAGTGRIPAWGVAIGVLAAFALAWIWWSIAVTHWRLRALTRVQAIQELMEAAEQERIIWPAGHWMERTEIRTRAQRELLEQLSLRLAVPDAPEDDPAVPEQTIARYAKPQMAAMAVSGALLLAIGIARWLEEADWFLLLMAAAGAWMASSGLRRLINRHPRLLIGRTGIAVGGEPMHPWDEVHGEAVRLRGSGRTVRTVLRFSHSSGETEIDATGLDIGRAELRHALRIHRLRWAAAAPEADRPTFAP